MENPRGKGEAITLGHEGPLIRLLRALPSWPDPPVEPPQHRPPLFSPFPNESRYRGHQAYKSVGTTMVNNLFPRLFLSRARSNYICHVHVFVNYLEKDPREDGWKRRESGAWMEILGIWNKDRGVQLRINCSRILISDLAWRVTLLNTVFDNISLLHPQILYTLNFGLFFPSFYRISLSLSCLN